MLIDEAEITIKGGHGGAGLVSFGKMLKSGPDGGNGGQGGNVYVKAVSDITLLNQFSQKTEFEAENGHVGGRNRKTGKNGKDIEILLPVGTSIIEIETKRENDLVTSGETYELTKVGQKELIAKGGIGGRGNWEFRSSKNTTPRFSQSGKEGEIRLIKLNLKLIADIGLIGLPNAGKSSLLNELTSAKAKVGAYAFTTLSPNLGNMNGKIIADIPGLIEGAHEGRGLGLKFLKHIEKTGVIVHCISCETKNLTNDYKTVKNELISYNSEIGSKKEIIVLTKTDLVDKKVLEKLIKEAKRLNPEVYSVSIHDFEALNKLITILTH